MSATPGTHGRDNRRRWIVIAIVLVIVAAAIGVAGVWLLFFGSEAPPAPTLDNALEALPSAPSGE